MSEEFKAITTQEELDNIIRDRLKRDREAQAKRYEGYISPEDHDKAIEEINRAFNDFKATHAGDEQTIADLTAKNKAYETASVKARICHEKGLPYELAERLSGETEQDISADADKLAQFVSASKPAAPLYNPQGNAGAKGTAEAAYLSMLGELSE